MKGTGSSLGKRRSASTRGCAARTAAARAAKAGVEVPAAESATEEATGKELDEAALEAGTEDVEAELASNQRPEVRDILTRPDDAAGGKPRFVPFDYGFQAAFLRTTPTVPEGAISLAFQNFGREYKALRQSYLFSKLSDPATDGIERGPVGLVLAYAGRAAINVVKNLDRFLTLYDGLPEVKAPQEPKGPLPGEAQELAELREKLQRLTLSNDEVWRREDSRPQVQTQWYVRVAYLVLCGMLDVIFNHRPIPRFWFLETVARMPYFSYISMLHLYETLGWWRSGAEVRKIHFAEEWNEMHHLKIMESLGGDRLWVDRFFAQHAAFAYYWILNFLFLISPKIAYNFSELIEMHAVDTYGTFVDENEALLKSLPPSPAAVAYYYNEDLYMFDEFQTGRLPESRRPKVNNLYDVFAAIRDDEREHVATMAACQCIDLRVQSPHEMAKRAAAAMATPGRGPPAGGGSGGDGFPAPHLSPHARQTNTAD